MNRAFVCFQLGDEYPSELIDVNDEDLVAKTAQYRGCPVDLVVADSYQEAVELVAKHWILDQIRKAILQ